MSTTDSAPTGDKPLFAGVRYHSAAAVKYALALGLPGLDVRCPQWTLHVPETAGSAVAPLTRDWLPTGLADGSVRESSAFALTRACFQTT